VAVDTEAVTMSDMPELPEVETVRRGVAPVLVGQRVVAAEVPQPHRHLVAIPDAVGLHCVALDRRGKVLIAQLMPDTPASAGPTAAGPAAATHDGGRRELVVHLGMTGRLVVGDTYDRHLRARLLLGDGAVICFVDPRRFGRLLVCRPGTYPTLPMLSELAPDPHDLDPARFAAALARSGRPAKACLLDQRLVAGVGNIYADEALWQVGLAPSTPGSQVTAAQAAALLEALRGLLDTAIAAGGSTVRDYRHADGTSGGFQHQLKVYGRAGQGCVACGTALVRDTLAGRTTVWCPACQV
jgi:formamidopyrimidine-DNA glycosylase